MIIQTSAINLTTLLSMMIISIDQQSSFSAASNRESNRNLEKWGCKRTVHSFKLKTTTSPNMMKFIPISSEEMSPTPSYSSEGVASKSASVPACHICSSVLLLLNESFTPKFFSWEHIFNEETLSLVFTLNQAEDHSDLLQWGRN